MSDGDRVKPSPTLAIQPPSPAGRGSDQSAGRPNERDETPHSRGFGSNDEPAGNLETSSSIREKPDQRPTAATDGTAPARDPVAAAHPHMPPQRAFPPSIRAAEPSRPPASTPTDALELSFGAEEAFPQNLGWNANDVPLPNFDRLGEAIAAIDQAREDTRTSQRRSRKARGAFTGDDEAMDSPGRIPKPTTDTLSVYRERGRGLFERYRREEQLYVSIQDVGPRDFAIWLLGVRPFWIESTWRANRIAACTFIRSVPHQQSDEALALLESSIGRRPLYQFRSPTAEVADVRSVTACRMNYDHLKKIQRALPRLHPRSEVVFWLNDWLVAGLFTGLGPDEWSVTELARRPGETSAEHFWLHVINAHATQAGHRGSYRTLDLSGFSLETRGAVARLADRARQWTLAGKFAQRKSEVSKLLETTSKTLFPRMDLRYDLESLQHQFVANMITVYGREHISALIGELFIDDQPANYTNRRRAWRDEQIVEIPVPLKDDVERYRRILAIFDERRVLRRLREKSTKRSIKPRTHG